MSDLRPSTVVSLRYPIGTTGQALVLPNHVVHHLNRHRQTRFFSREAGGQLFSRLQGGDVVVDRITGPRTSDWRTRTSYRPNRAAERREIRSQFREGFHFVGDWHSHPEAQPQPSRTDLLSIAECVRQSVHDLNGFILVLVGLARWPEGLHVSVHDGTTMAVLRQADDADGADQPVCASCWSNDRLPGRGIGP